MENVELRYKKLEDHLRKQIYEGIYTDGDLLPSENELCAAFRVTRSTVRKALDELAKDRLILKEKGRGSVVKREQKSLGLLGVKGFSQVAGGKNLGVTTKFLTGPVITQWPNPFFYELEEGEKNNDCIYIKRLRYVNAEIVMLENTFIAANADYNLHTLPGTSFVNGSFFETLHLNFGINMVETQEDLRAVAALGEIAQLLEVEECKPILNIYLKFKTNKKNLNVYSNMYCNTEKYSITNLR